MRLMQLPDSSRYSYTPLHNLRLPLWMLGFALHESIQQYPKVVTAKELQRKLGISIQQRISFKKASPIICSRSDAEDETTH
jgi:hypothetical protein